MSWSIRAEGTLEEIRDKVRQQADGYTTPGPSRVELQEVLPLIFGLLEAHQSAEANVSPNPNGPGSAVFVLEAFGHGSWDFRNQSDHRMAQRTETQVTVKLHRTSFRS